MAKYQSNKSEGSMLMELFISITLFTCVTMVLSVIYLSIKTAFHHLETLDKNLNIATNNIETTLATGVIPSQNITLTTISPKITKLTYHINNTKSIAILHEISTQNQTN